MLTKTNNKVDIEAIFKLFKQYKTFRIVVFTAGGLAAIYLIGKSCSVLATAVHGYKDLSNAIKR